MKWLTKKLKLFLQTNQKEFDFLMREIKNDRNAISPHLCLLTLLWKDSK